MANYKLLGPKFLQWEGWGGNDPLDHGGATRRGITLSTWKQFGYDKNHDGAIDQTDLCRSTNQVGALDRAWP